jgi:hypothetical protein
MIPGGEGAMPGEHSGFGKLRWLGLALYFFASSLFALDLGGISWATAPARPLTAITFSSSPVAFARFARAVGGVAFTTVAQGKDGLTVIALAYDSAQRDGSRLKVTLSDRGGSRRTVTGQIFDWQLVPLARFVRSGGEGAVTLFGELQDEARQERALQNGDMIANYHPALENTLLGLRLMQADLLVIEPRATDLFKEKGHYVLGAGEKAPNTEQLAANLKGFFRVHEWLDGQPEKFQSYIVSDIGRTVTFSFLENRLVLTGEPVWLCWRSEKEGDTDAPVIQMRTYSEQLSRKIREQNGINPVVYSALRTSMRYAALFRHAAKADPSGFNAFVNSLNTVPARIEQPDGYKMRTPTIYPRPR